jgi:hypothetical protein
VVSGVQLWTDSEARIDHHRAGAGTPRFQSCDFETDNSMEIFWVGAKGSVEDAFWYEGMDHWARFPIAPAGSASLDRGITAVSRIPKSMEIFWVGANGSVEDAFWYE